MKQRVQVSGFIIDIRLQSLARAIYSRKKLVIIDDLLSGLDWATQRHVWTNVFSSNGLLRQNDTTLVPATHACKSVKHCMEFTMA